VNASALSGEAAELRFLGGTTRADNEYKGCFAKQLPRSVPTPSPDVPAGHSIFRFSDTHESRSLLNGVGLIDVILQDHKATYLTPNVDTLWHGGLGSFALTASAITHQDKATQAAIRAVLERRASSFETPAGLELPIALKIGAGRKAN